MVVVIVDADDSELYKDKQHVQILFLDTDSGAVDFLLVRLLAFLDLLVVPSCLASEALSKQQRRLRPRLGKPSPGRKDRLPLCMAPG